MSRKQTPEMIANRNQACFAKTSACGVQKEVNMKKVNKKGMESRCLSEIFFYIN